MEPDDNKPIDPLADSDTLPAPPADPLALLAEIDESITSGMPYLIADAFGEAFWPTEEEQEQGAIPAMRMPYAATLGMASITGDPETPDLIAFLPERSAPILLLAAMRWQAGGWPIGVPLSGFAPHPIKFSPVHEDNHIDVIRDWRGARNQPMRFLQVLLPDAQGRFPDDEGVDQFQRTLQPLMVESWEKIAASGEKIEARHLKEPFELPA